MVALKVVLGAARGLLRDLRIQTNRRRWRRSSGSVAGIIRQIVGRFVDANRGV